MSISPKTLQDLSVLPQAIVQIKDICKSPSGIMDEQYIKKSRGSGSKGNEASTSLNVQREIAAKNIFEVMDSKSGSPRKNKKTSPFSKSKNLEASLKEPGSESGRVRMEKVKKTATEDIASVNAKIGRKSPRQRSPNSPSISPRERNRVNSDQSPEKPKINIFTDDIGKDLGKRIRSPRRLSEDMIALPIFAYRKAGQSPKDTSETSKNINVISKDETLGSVDSGNNIFKSPTPSKKSSPQRISHKKDVQSACSDSQSKSSHLHQMHNDSISDIAIEQDNSNEGSSYKLLMSSICRDVMKEMTSKRKDIFMKTSNAGESYCKDVVDNSKVQKDSVSDIESPDNKVAMQEFENDDQNSPEKFEESSGTDKAPGDEDNVDKGEDIDGKPSLLCAMLVGGLDVADDYSQKRERYKPEVTQISDSETEQSRAASPDLDFSQVKDIAPGIRRDESKPISPRNSQPLEMKSDLHDVEKKQISEVKSDSHIVEEKQISEVKSDSHIVEEKQISKVESETDLHNVEKQIAEIRSDLHDVAEEMETDLHNVEKKQISEMKSDLHDVAEEMESDLHNVKELSEIETDLHNEVKDLSLDVDHQVGQENVQLQDGRIKKAKILKEKKLDFSSQLKKMNEDILRLLDLDVEDQFMTVPNTEEIIKESVSIAETELFKLISSLGGRLKESGFSENEEIDKMIQSCSKGRVPVVSSSFSDRKWKSILDLLEKETARSSKLYHDSKIEKMSVNMENLVEKSDSSALESVKEESDLKQSDSLKQCDNPAPLDPSGDCKEDITTDLPSTSNCDAQSDLKSCLVSTSSSSLNGSLCELDLDDMTKAATQALKLDEMDADSASKPVVLCVSKDNEIVKDADKTVTPTKRTFQKSKTCGDFSIHSPSKSGTLQRSNSSPQLKVDSLPQISSPSVLRDQQIKSKLGGKIPVPGTSYPSKGTRKSWRKPRLIMDPKPLDVLLQFVKDKKQKEDVFTSLELQKYLWMPSNRMIITPQIRKEMNLADKTAEEAWDKKLRLMQQEEERQQKNEEEIDQEFMKHEPDFDEVDCQLFMSFSSEVELLAHVRVEKALEWDKDDTMLRISRAKTFEETKALNGDMKGVKMKKLRGQHMRWKKYRRLYNNEIQTILDAKERNVPLGEVKIMEKTCDISKIKGMKRQSILHTSAQDIKENNTTDVSINSVDKEYSPYIPSLNLPSGDDNDFHCDDMNIEINKRELSPRSRRRFNFSDQRAHKKLFRELNMDWEDRMIHRKLGGWSLKGNRPKQFSLAAKRREQKGIKVEGRSSVKDYEITPRCRLRDMEFESTHDALLVGSKKRKLQFPLLTERMVRNCLKTLELSDDVLGAIKRNKKKKRHKGRSIDGIPSLTPIFQPTEDMTSTPQSIAATFGSSNRSEPATPETLSLSKELMSPQSLSVEVPEETVMEGVEIVSQTSSPSVNDSLSSPQVKSCSKPGCRYGCICHLCSVNEDDCILQSTVTRLSSKVCDKEYCRLGCICDSLDPEQSVPTQAHCGKPSCMLECYCSTASSVDGIEDIPFLSSMKQRPRAGERFSNLPRREKTHRTAKNLDAITRKAMMLYETSEIFCEKVERPTKKKGMLECNLTIANVPTPTSHDSAPFLLQPVPMEMPTTNLSMADIVIDLIEPEQVESTVFNAVNLVTSEVATVTASQLSSATGLSGRSQLFPWSSKMSHRESNSYIEMNDVRQVQPNLEPSAHRRKRKSHPLSDEIFSVSSCARIQPYVGRKEKHPKVIPEALVTEQDATPSYQISAPNAVKQEFETHHVTNLESCDTSLGLNLKISGVCSLAEDHTLSMVPEKDSLQKDNSVNIVSVKTEKSTVPETPTINLGLDGASIKEERKCQHHGWHTSMVCLKARAVPKTRHVGEDDVQEEDEVKLLEFAANCNWESNKKDILSRVAGCLSRNQYPHPRTMYISEFVVEILPKAKQPSIIPPALRAKLPGQMYSIRVRITKRDDSIQTSDFDAPVIDLSNLSPVKIDEAVRNQNEDGRDAKSVPSSSIVTTFPESTTSSSSSSSSSSYSNSVLSSSPSATCTVIPSSSESSSIHHNIVGISGLSLLCMNKNDPGIKQSLNLQTKSEPVSRRSSVESFNDCRTPQALDDNFSATILGLSNGDCTTSSSPGCAPVTTTITSCDAVHVASQPLISQSSGNTIVTSVVNSNKKIILSNKMPITSTVTNLLKMQSCVASGRVLPRSVNLPKKIITGTTSLLKPGMTPSIPCQEKPNLKIPSFAIASGKPVSPALSPKSGEVKYVQMLCKVDGQKEKKKTLIAVPISIKATSIDLKNRSTITSMPILTVPKPSLQAKALPVLSPRSKNKVPVIQDTPIMKLSPASSPSLKPLQLVPLSSLSTVSPSTSSTKSSTALSTMCSSMSLPQSRNLEGVTSASDISLLNTSVDDKKDKTIGPLSTSVTNSRDRPISSTEISYSKDRQLSHKQDSSDSVTDGMSNKIASCSSDYNINSDSESPGKVTGTLKDCHLSYKEVSETCVEKQFITKVVSEPSDNDKESSCSKKESTTQPIQYVSSTGKSEILQVEFVKFREFSETEHLSGHDKDEHVNSHNDNNTYEVVDLEDLLTVSKSDCVATSTCLDSYSNKCESPVQEMGSTLNGMKRNVSLNAFEEEDCPESKKLKVENTPGVIDEDSNLSVVSASPQSYVSQAKSAFSSAVSSGSSEDFIVTLSSDEEIDVGEYTDDYVDIVEKAWENDHSSMFSKMPGTNKQKRSYAAKGIEILPKASIDKTEYHNYLERSRRAKLRSLFDELGDVILTVPGILSGLGKITDGTTMSKAKILTSAKIAIHQLEVKDRVGMTELSQQLERKDNLISQLKNLKAILLTNNMSGRAIAAIVNKVSRKTKREAVQTEDSDSVEMSTSQKPEDRMLSLDEETPLPLHNPTPDIKQEQVCTYEADSVRNTELTVDFYPM